MTKQSSHDCVRQRGGAPIGSAPECSAASSRRLARDRYGRQSGRVRCGVGVGVLGLSAQKAAPRAAPKSDRSGAALSS